MSGPVLHRPRRTTALLAAALAATFAATSARADDAPPPSAAAAAADEVVRLAKADDTEALRAIATAEEPSPWLVVDELHARGARPEAVRLAGLAAGVEAKALLEYAGHAIDTPPAFRARFAGADAAESAGDLDKALAALADAETLPASVLRVVWLDRLARLELRKERPAAARLAFEGAATAAERIRWRSEAALALGSAAQAAVRDQDYPAALDLYARKLEHHRAIDDTLGRVRTLGNLGKAASLLGERRRAVEYSRDALAALPQDAPPGLEAGLLHNLGMNEHALGNSGDAIRDLWAAMAAYGKAGDDLGAARVEADIGSLRCFVGDIQGARKSVTDALARAAGLPADRLEEPDVKRFLAICRIQQALFDFEDWKAGSTAVSLPALETTIEAVRKEFLAIGDSRSAANVASTLAEVLLADGKVLEARDGARGADATLTAIHDEEGSMWARNPLATAERRLGHLDEAARIRGPLLDAAERRGLAELVLEVLTGKAEDLEAAGDPAHAMATVEDGMRVLSGDFLDLGDGERAGARGRFAHLFEVGMRVAIAGQDDAKFLRFLEASRAGSLLEEIGSRDTVGAVHLAPELARERDAAREAVASAAGARRAAERGGQRDRIRTAAVDLAKAQQRYEEAVSAIRRRAGATALVVHPEPVSPEAARAALAPDEALVAFAVLPARTYALVVRKSGMTRVDLGKTADVRAACAPLLQMDDPRRASAKDPTKALADLRAVLWMPLGLPAALRTVYLCPDGPIGFVPFAALVPETAQPSIVFLPSITAWLEAKKLASSDGKKILAFGGPDYASAPDDAGAPPSAEPPAGSLRGAMQLKDLPFAREEAKAVGDVVRVGPEATESEFRKVLASEPAWRAVHLACHGSINGGHPALCALVLGATPKDDGFLTVFEIFDLQVRSDLVVLSACETAKGGIVRGEGIVGLTSAFLLAGSPRVVVSLWDVDDATTVSFMKRFYASWKEGKSPEVALREAQSATRANPATRHPFYWAGWCLWGRGS